MQEQAIQNKKVWRILLGKIFLLVQRIQHAAAKDGHHERSDKENQIKRTDGCQEPTVCLGVVGGRL